MVEALGHVTCHFNVLDLVTTHWHLVRFKHQNIRTHQHGVHEKPGSHIRVGVSASSQVFVNLRFVGVCAIQHAFAQHAG